MDSRTIDDRNVRLRSLLLEWGFDNLHVYPWRYINDPYKILISEFMLHRTQTRQVEPVYIRFITQYPTLAEYAYAPRNDVVTLVQSLGLRWRITGMFNALDLIWQKYGAVPEDYEKLLAIHGIGQYIAGATVCFTSNLPLTIVDSNIVRVIGRINDLDLSGEARRKSSIIQAIKNACDPYQPRNFYYALIDLAHQICKPKHALCHLCPILNIPCYTGQKVINGVEMFGDE